MESARQQAEREIAEEARAKQFRLSVEAEKARIRAWRKLTFWQKLVNLAKRIFD